jgi:hypothetical protein
MTLASADLTNVFVGCGFRFAFYWIRQQRRERDAVVA